MTYLFVITLKRKLIRNENVIVVEQIVIKVKVVKKQKKRCTNRAIYFNSEMVDAPGNTFCHSYFAQQVGF
jgi:hypothetical protein